MSGGAKRLKKAQPRSGESARGRGFGQLDGTGLRPIPEDDEVCYLFFLIPIYSRSITTKHAGGCFNVCMCARGGGGVHQAGGCGVALHFAVRRS